MKRFLSFIDRRLNVARNLGSGGCGGDYSDACVLLSSVISGIAADLWPGPGIDHVRFVETWVRYADPQLKPNLISLPLLARSLRTKGCVAEAIQVETLRPSAFGSSGSGVILTCDDVDLDEATLLQGSTVDRSLVRSRSYPSVFYQHVRSSLVHENHLDDRAAGVPMTDRVAAVSYVNVLSRATLAHQRRIHFHLEWLIDVVRSIAEAAEPDLQERPLGRPDVWWKKG
jgi:hypothetical protein